MTVDGASKDDVKLPEGDIGKDIQVGFDEGKDLLVTIVSAMGEEAVRFQHPCLNWYYRSHASCLGHIVQGGSQRLLRQVCLFTANDQHSTDMLFSSSIEVRQYVPFSIPYTSISASHLFVPLRTLLLFCVACNVLDQKS
jgi:Eukaryotic elongation factor 5A hypusine, DNA-binding OB fold